MLQAPPDQDLGVRHCMLLCYLGNCPVVQYLPAPFAQRRICLQGSMQQSSAVLRLNTSKLSELLTPLSQVIGDATIKF